MRKRSFLLIGFFLSAILLFGVFSGILMFSKPSISPSKETSNSTSNSGKNENDPATFFGDEDISVVFNPDTFIVNEPTQVRFQARINPDLEVNPESVYLYEVDEILNPLGSALCKLTDDGDLNNGDDIYEDGVFSCFATFLEAKPKKIQLAVQVITASGQPASSPAIFLNAVALLTLEEQVIIQTTQEQAWQVWEAAKAQLGDTLEARNKTVETIKNMPGVADVSVSEGGTIWIEYESGASGALLLNPEGIL